MKIAIIGAGWNGIHIALELEKKGNQVILFESNAEILCGLSGNFGARIHIGPHYPLSEATRKACQNDYSKFVEQYNDIVIELEKSYYALGKNDVLGQPSRCDDFTFSNVCKEFLFDETIELDKQSKFSRESLIALHSVREPSALVGQPLREKLIKRLQNENINIQFSSEVTEVKKRENKYILFINNKNIYSESFDHVVNTTAFKSLLPKDPLPFNMSIVSQLCAVTLVEDQLPQSFKPFSFTVMDGRYPCVMPYLDGKKNQYLVYHSLYSIVATFSSQKESWNYLNDVIDEDFLYKNVTNPTLDDLVRFIPNSRSRFKVIGTKTGIVQKVDTNSEYRGPIVFQSPEGMIYSISAKITNVCGAANDVLLLSNRNQHKDILSTESGYRYVAGGTLDHAKGEVSEERTDPNRTCAINRDYKPTPKML